MAKFTVHRITADYKYSDNTVVGEGWIAESAWHAQDMVDKLRLTRPELYNFKITSTGYGFEA
jgi:hypothetical protein